jgi:hypothetical protein
VAGRSAVRCLLAPQMACAGGIKDLDRIELVPRHSTREIPGKCLGCAAKHELNIYLGELLSRYEKGDKCEEVEKRFEALVSFLESPGLERLVTESEKYLAEGREVKLIIYADESQPKYELIVKWQH